ncbi:MAG: hypothetical protein ACMXYK_04180 [Candidatus Woesearchaeota archaeon]
MYYKIKLEKKAKKFIHKLDEQQKNLVTKSIDKLAEAPFPKNKSHILKLAGSSMLCELAIKKIRVYYTIENQFVVIEEIEYDGIVTILDGKHNHKTGNSSFPNQQKDIKKFKKEFSSKK